MAAFHDTDRYRQGFPGHRGSGILAAALRDFALEKRAHP